MTEVGAEEDIVLKILHTADWHIGRRFGRFDEEGQRKLSRARLEVLDRILLTAESNDVHAVLCAGDLFDEPTPTQEFWEPLALRFQKRQWKDRHVFLLPGNHDPLVADSLWTKERFRSLLPSFVHIVDREHFEFTLPNNAVLYAVPCMSKAGQNDPTAAIPARAPGDERIRIGMVHGSTYDVTGCQTNFPIHVDAAVRCGLDYLAIGDTHSFRFVPEGRLHPPTLYPGAPEPTAFDEKDPGHVAVVFFNRQRRTIVQKKAVAYWTWEEVTVETLEALRQLVRRQDLGSRVLRLRLDMCVAAPEYEEAERLLQELEGTDAQRGRAGVLDIDRQQFKLDIASVEQACDDLPAVLQATVARLKVIAGDPVHRPTAERALYHLYRVSRRAP